MAAAGALLLTLLASAECSRQVRACGRLGGRSLVCTGRASRVAWPTGALRRRQQRRSRACACLLTHASLPLMLFLQLRQSPSGGNGSSNGTSGGSAGQGGGGRYPDPSLTDSFVQVAGGKFVLGCREFPVAGLNA